MEPRPSLAATNTRRPLLATQSAFDEVWLQSFQAQDRVDGEPPCGRTSRTRYGSTATASAGVTSKEKYFKPPRSSALACGGGPHSLLAIRWDRPARIGRASRVERYPSAGVASRSRVRGPTRSLRTGLTLPPRWVRQRGGDAGNVRFDAEAKSAAPSSTALEGGLPDIKTVIKGFEGTDAAAKDLSFERCSVMCPLRPRISEHPTEHSTRLNASHQNKKNHQ